MSKASNMSPMIVLLLDNAVEQGNPQDILNCHMSSLMSQLAGFIIHGALSVAEIKL